MVRHVILWKLKDDVADSSKVKKDAKENLESLVGKIDGLIDLKLYTEGLESSNCDMMLDSSFDSYDALKAYAVHPDHVAAADNFVRPYTATRLCLDFEV